MEKFKFIFLLAILFSDQFVFAIDRTFVGQFADGSEFEFRQIEVATHGNYPKVFYILTFKKFMIPTYSVIYDSPRSFKFYKKGSYAINTSLESIDQRNPAFKSVMASLGPLRLILGRIYGDAGSTPSRIDLQIETKKLIYEWGDVPDDMFKNGKLVYLAHNIDIGAWFSRIVSSKAVSVRQVGWGIIEKIGDSASKAVSIVKESVRKLPNWNDLKSQRQESHRTGLGIRCINFYK